MISVLQRGQQQGEQADPPHGLPPGPLQLVVQLGVLELLEVERGRVPHELDAGPVGEQVAQQALEQRGDAAQPFADEGDARARAPAARQTAPIHRAARLRRADRLHHLVDDELPDPEHRQRHQRPGDPQQQDPGDVARLGPPHQPEQRGTCLSAWTRTRHPGSGARGLPTPRVGPYYRVPSGKVMWRKLMPESPCPDLDAPITAGENRCPRLAQPRRPGPPGTPPTVPVSIVEKVLRPVAVYLTLVFALAVGKRMLAQLNPFDFVVLLTLSNTVQNAIIGNDTSLAGGMVGAVALLGGERAAGAALLPRAVDGAPVRGRARHLPDRGGQPNERRAAAASHQCRRAHGQGP